jgi:hypothetical protein
MFSFLIILCLPGLVVAQHSYKFDSPKQIAGVKYDVRPQSLGIAWSGKVFGVVFDDYWYDKSSNTAYFMLVNKNGSSIAGPIKLARKQYVMDPRICWGDDSFLILYSAGRKKGKNSWKLNYYVIRFDEKGKKLSEEELDGIPWNDNTSLVTKMLWTGNAFHAVYLGNLKSANQYGAMLLCRISPEGIPEKSVVLLENIYYAWDVNWDGEQFIYADLFSLTEGARKTQARFYIFDEDGKTVASQTFVTLIPADAYQGVSIIPTHRSNRYLMAFSVLRPSNNPGPTAMHWYDVYASTVKFRKGKIKGFSPRMTTLNQPYDWSFPTLHRDGKNYYITAMLTTSGCSNAFARTNAKGKIVSAPLMRMVPGPGCGAWPPYSVMAGKECAWVYCEGAVYFQIIKP